MKNTPFPIKQIEPQKLKFDENGSPYSHNYNDIYFQSGIGLEEKQHVFLNGNNLPENWHDKTSFTIAETGFGTGLNFLNTLKLWDKNKQPNQRLDFISCELHPLAKAQLEQALSAFKELEIYTESLIENYPEILVCGFHRIHFEAHNATLTLIFGEAVDAFKYCNSDVDAWFLDGFAPSKNSDMWSDDLFQAIANLSHIGTTASTYTVARKIRDGLTAVGFDIKKTSGFGQKREMLTAQLCKNHKIPDKLPWAQTFASTKHESFTVIGAGIAGLTLAHKLQTLGKKVTLIDRQKQPCMEASGNPQAMIMPSLDLNGSPLSRFYLSAFLYAINYYSEDYYHPVGVHEIPFTEKQKYWQAKFLKKFSLPHNLIHEYKGGILYPQAGWLDTQGHAQSIYNKLENYIETEVTKIDKIDDLWYIYKGNNTVHTTHTLILANGINIKSLLPDYELPITPKHGEISYFKSKEIDELIATNPHIQLSRGYITPQWNGIQTLGATFNHINNHDWYKPALTSSSHWQQNTELWDNTPYAHFFEKDISHKSRAGIRVTTHDHLPICGAVIDQNHFKQHYKDICHGKHWKQYPQPKPSKNLYLMAGLGSRGYTSAPILAELLCNQMLNLPQVLNSEQQKCINSNRFLYKSMTKYSN